MYHYRMSYPSSMNIYLRSHTTKHSLLPVRKVNHYTSWNEYIGGFFQFGEMQCVQLCEAASSKTVRKKMKAPDDKEDEDHLGSGWSEEDLKSTYHRKELRDFVDQDPLDATMELIRLVREAGMIPGSFDADTLFDLDLEVIQATSRDLFLKLKIIVGEVHQSPDPLPLTTADTVDNLTVSSHYASAAEDGSDTSLDSTATDASRTLWGIDAGGEI
ncbi:hypothetical protein PHMEG_00036056 [Phytophthora megakarya]|uniref:Uncharacterized protein n=1 Tax=Phytophthora megakarya TaxID=4795 RepID=A0A225UMA4_9STRA|nr:hypothetical protein PHMEG_00036056 [Phytophthora megakarya]